MPSFKKSVLLCGLVAISMSLASAQDADVEAFNEAYTAYKLHAQSGEYAEAASQGGRAADIGAAMYGDDSPEAAALTFNHAIMLRLSGQFEAARDVLDLALSRYEALHGKRSHRVIPIHMESGRLALKSRKRRNVPTASFDRALKIAEKVHGKASAEVAGIQLEIGTEVMDAVISSEAVPYLKDARENLRRLNGPNDESAGLASYQLGRFYYFEREFGNALKYLQEALASFADPESPASAIELRTHTWLVGVYEETGSSSAAAKHIEIIAKARGYDDSEDMLPVYRVAPRYPMRALAAGSQGWVDLSFTVDERGMVRDPEVVSRTGHEAFEEAALGAVSKFRYAPRIVDGEAVSVKDVTTRISFMIEN